MTTEQADELRARLHTKRVALSMYRGDIAIAERQIPKLEADIARIEAELADAPLERWAVIAVQTGATLEYGVSETHARQLASRWVGPENAVRFVRLVEYVPPSSPTHPRARGDDA